MFRKILLNNYRVDADEQNYAEGQVGQEDQHQDEVDEDDVSWKGKSHVTGGKLSHLLTPTYCESSGRASKIDRQRLSKNTNRWCPR